MTRAAFIFAAIALSGCVKPAEVLRLAPTPADVCGGTFRGLLIAATGSDAANVALACNIVK